MMGVNVGNSVYMFAFLMFVHFREIKSVTSAILIHYLPSLLLKWSRQLHVQLKSSLSFLFMAIWKMECMILFQNLGQVELTPLTA